MADSGIALATASVRRLAAGRFVGQGFDLVVTLPDGPYTDDAATRARLKDAFERAYREKFALTPPNVPVEFINVRVTVRAPIAGAEMRLPLAGGSVGDAVKGVRPAYFPEARGWVDTTVYDRERLAPGFEFAGPAVVEEEGSTLVVGPSGRVHVSRTGNLVVTLA
jgi:N-methylhydantoinase A